MSIAANYLSSYLKRSLYYKELGDQTFAQITEADFNWQYNAESNSIAIIIQHLAGNMRSRFTDFLQTDGEKTWRNRDTEFESQQLSKQTLIQLWNEGWLCFLNAVEQLQPDDLEKTVFIRSEPLTVIDALNRQLAHYPYHVGQIVFIGRMIRGSAWQSLSIVKGKSDEFNSKMNHK